MFFRIRRTARPAFSGRGALAAATPRARCVLAEGCPVLRVHLSLGFARHIGQRTANICRNVSFSGCTLTLFNSAHLKDGQSCSRDQMATNGNLPGTDKPPLIIRQMVSPPWWRHLLRPRLLLWP